MRVCTAILYGQGINADAELGWAFELAGSKVQRVHVLDLIQNPGCLEQYQILAFPGGFSFGDHLGSGRVLALELGELTDSLLRFLQRGLMIGICNGFQVLAKMGLLPMLDSRPGPEASLDVNSSGRFIDRWVSVKFEPNCPCVWTRDLTTMDLPVRHGEGRFIASPQVLDRLERQGQVALRYGADQNPNGSMRDIAGVCDPSGRVLGLMPHPETYLKDSHHPLRRRVKSTSTGLTIFENAVRFLLTS